MQNPNRPIGVTILAAILMLIALRGFSSLLGAPDQVFSQRIASAAAADLLGVAYALCAIVAAVALWEMKTWAIYAYAAWAALHVIAIAAKDITLKVQGKTESEWWFILLGPAIFAVVLASVGMALKKSWKPSA